MAMVSLEDGLGRHNQNVPMRRAENACLEWILAHGSSDAMRVRRAKKIRSIRTGLKPYLVGQTRGSILPLTKRFVEKNHLTPIV
jgi:hypothetical protein